MAGNWRPMVREGGEKPAITSSNMEGELLVEGAGGSG